MEVPINIVIIYVILYKAMNIDKIYSYTRMNKLV